MNIIRNIVLFLKKIFNKKNNIKMIDAPVEDIKKDDKDKFINSLKLKIGENTKRKKVETLTCFGDGLGIQTKINY